MNLYILAFILFILAFFLFNKRVSKRIIRKRKYIKTANRILLKLNDGTFEKSSIIPYLRKVSPYVFEELLLTSFESKGYKIVRNKRYSHDGGIDGILYNGNIKYIIQAKRYKEYVSAKHLEDFNSLVQRNNCIGLFIHTGRTGRETFNKYRKQSVVIISGSRLIELITLDLVNKDQRFQI